MLPSSLVDLLQLQLEQVRALHVEDVAADFSGASMTEALARKFSVARRELSWRYVFPHSRLAKDPRSEEMLRHHARELLPKCDPHDGEKSGHRKTRDAACVTAQFCYAYAGRWGRYPHSAGSTRTCLS